MPLTATFTAPDLRTARAEADAWVRKVDPHEQHRVQVITEVTIRVTVGEDE